MQVKRISVMEALRFSFKAILNHIRLFSVVLLVGAGLIVVVVALIALFNKGLVQALMSTPMFQSIQECVGRQCFTIVYQSGEPVIRLMINNSISVILSALALGLFFVGLDLGFKKIALQVYDNNASHVETLFSHYKQSLTGLIAWIIYCAMVWVGFICFVVPGFIVLLRFAFFPFFIIDKNAGIIESLQMSYNATRGHIWDIFAFWLVIKVIVYLCFLSWIGIIIAWPLSTLAYAYVYRHLLGNEHNDYYSETIMPSA